MDAVLVLLTIAGIYLIYRSYRMSAALDNLTAAIQANASATAALIQAYQTAPANIDAALNVLTAQVEQETTDINNVLGVVPPTAP